MTTKKIRVVAYLDPLEYRQLKARLAGRGLDFSKWVRHQAKEELKRSREKQIVL